MIIVELLKFYGIQSFNIVVTKTIHESLSRARSIPESLNTYSYLSFPFDYCPPIFFLAFSLIFYKHSYFFHSGYMISQFHPPLNHLSNWTLGRVYVMKFLLIHFYSAFCQSSLLDPNRHRVLKQFLCISFFNVRDKISHPYKSAGENIIPCILIVIFSETRREAKICNLNGSKHYPS